MELHDPNPDSPAVISPPAAGVATLSPATTENFDCWNKIGVSGDGTCAELDKFVHCRNCPVYSAAARQLLDRPPPPDYRRDWSGHFSRAKNLRTPGKLSAVIFRIGVEWLALPTKAFQEVAEQRRIHSLPRRRQSLLLGLINIRGELQLCVSLGRLLGIESSNPQEDSISLCDRLVVAHWQGSLLTFPVNEIHGVHRYHSEELKEAPATVTKSNVNFIRGLLPWRKNLVACLDEDLLFSTLNRSLT